MQPQVKEPEAFSLSPRGMRQATNVECDLLGTSQATINRKIQDSGGVRKGIASR